MISPGPSNNPPPQSSPPEEEDIQPSRLVYGEFPVYQFSEWESVDKVRAALEEMERGHFSNVALLVETMGRDARLRGVLNSRIKAVLGKPLEFESRGNARRSRSVIEKLEEDFPRMLPDAQSYQLLRWGLMLGVGVGQLAWDTGDKWTPRLLKVFHPRYLYWRWDRETFFLNTQEGQVEIMPGDPNWLIFAPYGRNRGWLEGLVRSLAIPWLVRNFALRDWARYSEVHGMPIRLAEAPPTAAEADKKRFFREVANLQNESTIKLPQGADGNKFDVRLLEAVGNTWQGFQALMSKTEDAYAIATLGQNLTTEVKEGSRAAAQVHQGVRDDIVEGDAKALGVDVREQMLKPWAKYNFGDPDLAPDPKWQVQPPEDLSEKATRLNTLGQALGYLRTGGMPVDTEELAEEFSIPLGDEPIENPPAPLAPGSASPPPGSGQPGAQAGSIAEPTKTHALVRTPKGARRGQIYADEVADSARELARKALKGDREALADIIKGAETLEQIRRKLVGAYKKMSPRQLAKLTEQAIVLAELAGRQSVREDT